MKSNYTDARWLKEKSRKSKSRRDRAIRYLKRCNIKLIENLPPDLDALIIFYYKYKHHKNPGFTAFARHCLTNYDRICENVYQMFGIGMNEEMQEVLQERAHLTALPYLKAIGFVDWHNSRGR